MAAKSLTEYSSQALFGLTESAANTLTFEKLETGLSVYDKVGWIIQRLEWKPGATAFAMFNGSGDTLSLAVTMTNTLTSLANDNPAILFKRDFVRVDLGVAAAGSIVDTIFEQDYSTLAGGGILVLPSPLYGAIVGGGLTAAATGFIRIYFKAIELSDTDYFNLVQARQLLIST